MSDSSLCDFLSLQISSSKMSKVVLALMVQTLLRFIHVAGVDLVTMRATSPYHRNIVKMTCRTDSNDALSGNVTFYNTVGQTTRLVMLEDNVSLNGEFTWEITPENEGNYHCQVDGERSNTVLLIGEFNSAYTGKAFVCKDQLCHSYAFGITLVQLAIVSYS